MDTNNQLPAPLTPADCDLRDFQFMPLDVQRLRDSDLAALETPEACWAAVMLWAASWHQVPAASLPDDDRVLSNLSGYGRIVEAFQKIREGALRSWVKCSDGRLYHPIVAEKANESWTSKVKHSYDRLCERTRKENKKREENMQPLVIVPPFDDWVAAGRPLEKDARSAGKKPESPRNSTGTIDTSAGTTNSSAGIPPEDGGNSAGIPQPVIEAVDTQMVALAPQNGANDENTLFPRNSAGTIDTSAGNEGFSAGIENFSAGIPPENALKGQGQGEVNQNLKTLNLRSEANVTFAENDLLDEVETTTPEPTAKAEKQKRFAAGKRFDANLTEIPGEWLAFGIGEGMSDSDATREFDKFRDYWLARPGQGGAKLDWFATYRNWIRSALDKRPARLSSSPAATGTGTPMLCFEEETSPAFQAFVAAYPKKRDIPEAWAAWQALDPNEAMSGQIMSSLAEQVISRDWVDHDGKYIPKPAKWLSDRRWTERAGKQSLAFTGVTNENRFQPRSAIRSL